MKTKEFIQSLRKLIREEVRAAVRDELSGIINESIKAQKPKQQSQPQQQYKKPSNSNFNTGNATLDEILAETIVPRGFGGESGPAVSDYTDMHFTTNDVPQSLSTIVSDEDLPITTGYSDPTMMFVKDYSAIMNKANQIGGKY